MAIKKFRPGMVTLILLALLPDPASAQNVSASSSQKSNVTVHTNNEVYRYSSSSPTQNFKIEMRGKIELTDDDKDIKSISEDGYLEISKTVFGSKRSIVIESLGDGRVKKEYYEGRSLMPWEPNGKQWLSEILPEVVRSSTIGAESRVKRFFNKGGTMAVLNEIEEIESDHVKTHYANALMKHPVPARDYQAIVKKMSEEVDSDHYMAEFLRRHVEKFMQQNEATTAVFTAVKEMDSDHYKTLVISESLKGNQVSPENLKVALVAASQMDSDHYITEVLTNLLKQNEVKDATIAEIINTTKGMESDHYKTIVLTKALDKTGLSDVSHNQVVESVKQMSSDHYITEVIKHLMGNKISDGSLSGLLDMLSSIESDHYRTDILRRILSQQNLTEEQFAKIITATSAMDSDHYKTEVLKDAMNRASSNKKMVGILNAAKEMDSDHYISEVLISAAPKVKTGSAEMKDAYRASAKSISSETYYGRALRAIE